MATALAALVGLFAAHPTPLLAQTTGGQDEITAITTAVPFLMIAPDSKSGALGEAGAAIADNANATYWNFSNMAFTENKYGFSVNYTPWLRALGIPDINHAYLPGYINLGEKGGVVGASLTFFSLGNIKLTDNGGIEIGDYNPSEWALAAHYTRLITEHLAVGAGLRYIHSNLAGTDAPGGIPTNPGRSFAADINFAWKKDYTIQRTIPLQVSVGGQISNIGNKMTYFSGSQTDFIPTNLRLGYALAFKADDYNTVTFTNDFNKLMVPSEGGRSDKGLLEGMFGSFGDAPGGFSEEMAEINMSFGLEWMYRDIFALRGGYFYEPPSKGNRSFITLGAGLHFKMVTFDFAYLTSFQENHPLQNTLRFSLSFDFGGPLQ